MYLDDDQDAWLLNPDGTYIEAVQDKSKAKLNDSAPGFSAQQQLIKKYAD
jgi:hypothetical protein